MGIRLSRIRHLIVLAALVGAAAAAAPAAVAAPSATPSAPALPVAPPVVTPGGPQATSEPLPSFSASPTTTASPTVMPTAPAAVDLRQLDAMTREAVRLERTITDLRAERDAIEQRIAVTSERIQRQRMDVDAALQRYEEAHTAYRGRLIEIYKSFESDPILVLLGARTFSDLVSRSEFLSRLMLRHQEMLDRARFTAAEAEHEESVLDDLRRQDVTLRQLLRIRLGGMDAALARQKELVSRMSAQSRQVLVTQRRIDARTRKQWRASSVPLEAEIRQVEGRVEPYPFPFLVSEFHPRAYRSTGVRFTAVCSWYGNEFHGRPSASGQIYNQNDFTCASKTLPFGTRLALRRAGRAIVVVVTDRGPFVAGRDLDLSRAAARALGFSGVQAVEAEVVTIVK